MISICVYSIDFIFIISYHHFLILGKILMCYLPTYSALLLLQKLKHKTELSSFSTKGFKIKNIFSYWTVQHKMNETIYNTTKLYVKDF